MTTTDRIVFIGGGVVMAVALFGLGWYTGSVLSVLAGLLIGILVIALAALDAYMDQVEAEQEEKSIVSLVELGAIQRRAAMRRAETAIHESVAHLRVVSSERPCHGCAAWTAEADLVDGYCAPCRESAQPQDAA